MLESRTDVGQHSLSRQLEYSNDSLPGLYTSELTRDGCFTASITNRLCKVLAAVYGAFNAGSSYQAAAHV